MGGKPLDVPVSRFQEPLPFQHAQFCIQHSSKNNGCVIVGCTSKVTPGFQTCLNASHHSLEDPSNQSALFVLQCRLEQLRTSLEGDDGQEVTGELVDIDADRNVLPNQRRVIQSLVLILVAGAHTISTWLLLHMVSFLGGNHVWV